MTGTGKSLPKDVVEHWPEVFDEIRLNVLPLDYLHAVLINFKNGQSWEIKVSAAARREGWDHFEKKLSELLKTYEEKILEVDFKIDSHRVKRDIKKSTEKFLKKRKLD